jgi:hypothetical protein
MAVVALVVPAVVLVVVLAAAAVMTGEILILVHIPVQAGLTQTNWVRKRFKKSEETVQHQRPNFCSGLRRALCD